MSVENIGILMEKMRKAGSGCAGCMGGTCSGCPFIKVSEQKAEVISSSPVLSILPVFNRFTEMKHFTEIACKVCGRCYEAFNGFSCCPHCGENTKSS